MKLRNKISGKIKEFALFDGNELQGGVTLESLTKEWEDYEEPKQWWYLDVDGEVCEVCGTNEEDDMDKDMKSIGNYFETKEEAEKAVEKLKAWNRIKKGGFRFISWNSEIGGEDHFDCCGMVFITGGFGEGEVCKKDLDLLFGGEE